MKSENFISGKCSNCGKKESRLFIMKVGKNYINALCHKCHKIWLFSESNK